MRRYKDMDIKFAFLSTMSSFNVKMRNVCFKNWLQWKLSAVKAIDPGGRLRRERVEEGEKTKRGKGSE